ncbi:MAG TPA: hypothetical protein DEG96_06505 [Candidatus Atribacteria bacterium]|nr:hypothetical protein [Candidatus Atribacteria bacterium]
MRMRKIITSGLICMLICLLIIGVALCTSSEANWTIKLGATNVIDLSYPLYKNNEGMSMSDVYIPLDIRDEITLGSKTIPFPATVDDNGYPVNGFYAREIYGMLEGHGTHVEASSHGFGELGRNIDDYPLSRFIGPAVVINIEAKAVKNPDYEITVEDLRVWEKKYGKIPDGACVILFSGRGKYWGDKETYFGMDAEGKAHYPGFSIEAAKFLVKDRHISMMATDCPTAESALQKRTIKTERAFGSAPVRDIVQCPPNDVIIIEYLANVEKLPESGALIIAAPINFVDGAQGTARILAVLP